MERKRYINCENAFLYFNRATVTSCVQYRPFQHKIPFLSRNYGAHTKEQSYEKELLKYFNAFA